jgi:CO dehydrogenase maturation factor
VSTVRIAFVGKGGAGKSSIAGTFARLLARRGERVLALDSDPMPGLAFSLGMDRRDAGIPEAALEEQEIDGRTTYRLRPGFSVEEAILRYAAAGPDGVRLLQLGKARGVRGENARSHQAFQHLVEAVPRQGWSVVGDLPGGTRQPFFGWGRFARTLLVVVEPTPASLLSARRLARLAAMPNAPRVVAVASKTREPDDAQLVGDKTGLPVIGSVPTTATFISVPPG